MKLNKLFIAMTAAFSASAYAAGTTSAVEKSFSVSAYSIGVQSAYTLNATGSGIRVGVIDTGLTDFTKQLTGRIYAPYDVTTKSNNVTDTLLHGTKVAGIIGAAMDGVGISGVAPDVTIIPVKVFSPSGLATNQNIFDGVNYALQNGARIINLSMQSVATTAPDTYVRQAVNSNALVVIAAGNNGLNNPSAVASFANQTWANGQVIVVGAVDSNNIIMSWSNKAGSQKNFYLVAPGNNVITTCTTGYCFGTGTSFAAPFVSGAAASVMSNWKYLTANQTADILFKTATDLGAPGTDEVYGRGMVNLTKALQPIGDLKVVTGSQSNVKVASISTAISPALMNSLSTQQIKVSAFDDYGRNYNVNLSNSFHSYRSTYTQKMFSSNDIIDSNGFSVGNIKFNSVSSYNAETKSTNILAASLIQSNDNSTYAMGFGGTSSQFFGLNTPMLSEVTSNSYVSNLIPNHSYMGYSYNLNGANFKIGYVTTAASNVPNAQSNAIMTEIAYKMDNLNTVFSYAQLNESGALGSTGNIFGNTVTSTYGISTAYNLNDYTFATNYGIGYSTGNNSNILSISDVKTVTWGLGVAKSKIMSDFDSVSFSVYQPMAVTSGNFNVNASVGVTNNGTPIVQNRSYNLSAYAPVNTELKYTNRLTDASNLTVSLINQQSSGFTDKAAVVKYNLKF
jgi:hypothetical protein